MAYQTNNTAAIMANLTATFNGLLKGHEARPTKRIFLDDFLRMETDGFLKEAYRIVRHLVIYGHELSRAAQANGLLTAI